MRWFRRAKQGEVPPPVLPEPELVRARLQLACQLPALADARGLLERLADDYARTRALAERPLRIALVGSTGAGKSTLLNALAGTVLAREGVDRPTSSEAVAYAPSDADLGSLGAAVPRVVRYLTEAGSAWSGQVFVDTPDLNSVARENAAAALAVLDQVDAALVVFHRGSESSSSFCSTRPTCSRSVDRASAPSWSAKFTTPSSARRRAKGRSASLGRASATEPRWNTTRAAST